MSAYELFTKALQRASSSPNLPSSPQAYREVSLPGELHIMQALDRERPCVGSATNSTPLPPPNTPNDLLAQQWQHNGGSEHTDMHNKSSSLQSGFQGCGFGPCRNFIGLSHDQVLQRKTFEHNPTQPVNLGDFAEQNRQAFAGEAPQVKARGIEDLFSDINKSEECIQQDDQTIDKCPGEDWITPSVEIGQEGPKVEEKGSQIIITAPPNSWQPFGKPVGTSSYQKHSLASRDNYEADQATLNQDYGTVNELRPDISESYMMSGALGRESSRTTSPTESELAAVGFEFHNELPEDMQIDRFSDKTFRKALREVKPELPRKQQWYAWKKVKQMLQGRVDEADDREEDDNRKMSWRGVSSILTAMDEEGATFEVNCPVKSAEQGIDPSLGTQSDEKHNLKRYDQTWIADSDNQTTFHWASVEDDDAAGSEHTRNSGCACSCGQRYHYPSEKCDCSQKRDQTISMEQSARSDRFDDQPYGRLVLKTTDKQQARHENGSEADLFELPLPHSQQPAKCSGQTAPKLPVGREVSTSISPPPSFSQLEVIQHPDTPSPRNELIRQSVEPGTPLHLLHRESTPAFETRSPSPSPISHADIDQDVDMRDATPRLPALSQPPISPDPISSSMHTVCVTAPDTPLPISSPVPKPKFIAPPIPMTKPAKRGERKSIVQGSKVGKGGKSRNVTARNVTTKITNSVRKMTEKVKKEETKVADAASKIEESVRMEGGEGFGEGTSIRRSARIGK